MHEAAGPEEGPCLLQLSTALQAEDSAAGQWASKWEKDVLDFRGDVASQAGPGPWT